MIKAIKTLVRNIRDKRNPDLSAMKYAVEHGFVHGDNFQYNSGYPIDANWPWLISVGDNVTLSSGVRLLAHDASTAKTGVTTKVGNNVFIGENSIVLPNVRIGNNVIIGAGSVVSKDIPNNCVFAGNPAKYLCSFEEFSDKHHQNQNEHPVFREYNWLEWKNAPKAKQDEMRQKLQNSFGYL